MTSPIRSLDARYYTDPQVFEVEKAGASGAHMAIRLPCQPVREPGRLLSPSRWRREPVLHPRPRRRDPHLLQRLPAPRAPAGQGEGSTRVVVCPYHAWTYELTGELRAGPTSNRCRGFDKSKDLPDRGAHRGLPGFIFVNLDPDAAPMDDWFPACAPSCALRAQMDELKPLEWVEIPENCNWKVSVENYSECYHCSLNHPTFATGVIKPETYDIQPQGYCLRHTTECRLDLEPDDL
jgi:hypothetical protein